MWKLVPLQAGGETFYLLPGKDYVVGRKNCDIILCSDQSISRAHALLSLSNQTLTLKDTSKYGTFVNDAQLPSGTIKALSSGDRLTFGVYQSKFRVEAAKLKVCSSCLVNEHKVALSQALTSLGGCLVGTWDQECTHLVMPSVKVTIKTICALLSGKPIVKPEFFSALGVALREGKSPPKVESYYPEIDEPSLKKDDVDLSSRPERQQIFAGKTFVFLSAKQMKRLSQAVSCGGGKCQLLEEGAVPVSLLESQETCVIDMVTGSSQSLISASDRKWCDAVSQVLHRQGLRWIPESEVGLAAIYFNHSSYCNPSSPTEKESGRVRQVIPGPSLSQSAAVDETVLPVASQNITAYAVNTEPSQTATWKKFSEKTSVEETPEKQSSTGRYVPKPGSESSTSFSSTSTTAHPKPAVTRNSEASFTTIAETVMSSHSGPQSSQSERSTKAVTALLSRNPNGRDGYTAKFKAPHSAASKASPQKQSSLTSFFQPVSKKRARDGGHEPGQSEMKHMRLDSKEEDHGLHSSSPSSTSTSTPLAAAVSASRAHRTEHTNTTTNFTTTAKVPQESAFHRDKISGLDPVYSTSPSLGLGPGLGSVSKGGLDSPISERELWQETKKRKEQVQDKVSKHDATEGELDLSLEDLESIMMDDMDMEEDPLPGPSANKKLRLDELESSTANQKQEENQRANGNIGLKTDTLNGATRKPGAKTEEFQAASHDQFAKEERRVSTTQTVERVKLKGRDAKEEEVSFVVADLNGDATVRGKALTKNSSVKEEKDCKSGADSKGDENLPRGLLLVQFKSLLVSNPNRNPGQHRSPNPNLKNFKRFRKVPVPGSQGLPQIIGGSDLVAHSKGKASELDEWLKEAAEEEAQIEKEQAIGDELFRYNPRPATKKYGKF